MMSVIVDQEISGNDAFVPAEYDMAVREERKMLLDHSYFAVNEVGYSMAAVVMNTS
jgi:hypothetical protein